MPYPFAQAPTTKELIALIEGRFGIKLGQTKKVTGPRGRVLIRYFWRQEKIGDTVLMSEPLPERDDERIGWDMLSRICRQLRIPAEEIGIPGLGMGLPDDPSTIH